MAFSTQKTGRDGEEIAVAFLRYQGLQILERNWRPTQMGLRGEIDIVAKHGEAFCFVEVKTRASDDLGAPQEAVTPAKQRQISRLANAYFGLKGLSEVVGRFDIIEVWLVAGQKPRVAWMENAFPFQG